MDIALLTTLDDPASRNIREQLLTLFPFVNNSCSFAGHTLRLYQFPGPCISLEHVDQEVKADIIVFCTKHQSKSGIPCLSVHVTGNFSDAQMGGESRQLCNAHAELMYHCYKALFAEQQARNLTHEVVYEATHHGPFLDAPVMFIEIGSTDAYWSDPIAGAAIAHALHKGISALGTPIPPVIIGIGGLHTCPEFNKLVQRNLAAPGHICPYYMLDKLDEELLKQMISRTIPAPTAIVLDWKSLGPNKEHILKLLENAPLPVLKTKEYKESGK